MDHLFNGPCSQLGHGIICVAGIAVFSIGEMLSSPKKMEYLASLSPKGQEALFMGYANIPVAIGWIAGSMACPRPCASPTTAPRDFSTR